MSVLTIRLTLVPSFAAPRHELISRTSSSYLITSLPSFGAPKMPSSSAELTPLQRPPCKALGFGTPSAPIVRATQLCFREDREQPQRFRHPSTARVAPSSTIPIQPLADRRPRSSHPDRQNKGLGVRRHADLHFGRARPYSSVL